MKMESFTNSDLESALRAARNFLCSKRAGRTKEVREVKCYNDNNLAHVRLWTVVILYDEITYIP